MAMKSPTGSLTSESFNTMSPGGTPENLEGKFDDRVKQETPPISPSKQPLTVTVGDFDITVSPKPPSKTRSARSVATATAGTRSTTSSPSSVDVSTMTEDLGGTAKEISDLKQRMKENLVFIREKTEERNRLNKVIQDTTKENARLGSEMIQLVEVEEAKMGELEKKNVEMNAELSRVRQHVDSLKKDFSMARESMGNLFGKFEKFGVGGEDGETGEINN